MSPSFLQRAFCCSNGSDISRSLPPSRPIYTTGTTEPTAFQRQAALIAQRPVNGMGRTAHGAGYIRPIDTRQPGPDAFSPVSSMTWSSSQPYSSADTDKWDKPWEGATRMDEKYTSTPMSTKSTSDSWRHTQESEIVKPNDRQEILSGEDEEAWARMMT